MTEDQRIALLTARIGNFLYIMRTTLFVLLGIGIASHVAEGYNSVLMVLSIAITAFGLLAGGAAMDDMAALRDDMSEDMANTTYGRAIKARDFGRLKLISSVLIGLTGLAAVLSLLV